MPIYAAALKFSDRQRPGNRIFIEIITAQHEQEAEEKARKVVCRELKQDRARGHLNMISLDEIEEEGKA